MGLLQLLPLLLPLVVARAAVNVALIAVGVVLDMGFGF